MESDNAHSLKLNLPEMNLAEFLINNETGEVGLKVSLDFLRKCIDKAEKIDAKEGIIVVASNAKELAGCALAVLQIDDWPEAMKIAMSLVGGVPIGDISVTRIPSDKSKLN